MILTDKAKEDFFNHHYRGVKWTYEDVEHFCWEEDIVQYALIIEWLDSLRTLSKKRGVYKFKQLYLSSLKEMENHHSISEIQKRAIIKANEIYNNK